MHNILHKSYKLWSKFVVAHTLKIIFACSVITAVCALKFLKTKQVSNIRGYTPYGSRALKEFDIRDEFFDQNGVGIRHFVLVIPKEGKNMLAEENLNESIEVDKFIRNNITMYNRITKKNESFSQFCKLFCSLNDPVPLFYVGLVHQKQRLARNESLNPSINLTYPTSIIFGRKVNLLQNFYGIHFKDESPFDSSNTFTNMDSAEMLVFLYRAERVGGWTDEDVNNYEIAVSNYFRYNYTNDHIRVLTISTSVAQVELDRSGKVVRSYVFIGVTVMITCALVTTILCALYMDQFSWFRIPVPIFGCLSPFLASATALGFILFLGVRNSSVLSFTPFLILAFGIDDAFLTIYMWQFISSKREYAHELREKSDINKILRERLTIVLGEIGPSILISALTNITADTVGMFTGSPEITLLCIGSISAIIVDFIYQITFFTAVLVYCAKWELWWKLRKQSKISDKNGPVANGNHSIYQIDTRPQQKKQTVMQKIIEVTKKYFGIFVDNYIKFISNIVWATLITVAWFGLLAFCFMCIFRIEINLSMEKLFPLDSPLIEVSKYREDVVMPSYTVAQLFVNNPGDLNNRERRQRLNYLVEEMENLPHAYSDIDSTSYFVRPFMDFEETFHEMQGLEEEELEEEVPCPNDELNQKKSPSFNKTELQVGGNKFPKAISDQLIPKDGVNCRKAKVANTSEYFNLNDLEDFLRWPEYEHWKGYLKHHNVNGSNGQNKTVLDTVMITVAYHGDELKNWYNRALMLKQWRVVVDRYKEEFNVSVLHDEGLYLDLLDNMPKNIWQSAVAVLVCMGTICAVFMREVFVVVIAIIVIASIMIELLGLIAIQGMTIDPIVMAVIVIAMGFSVDIPAHVSYHFYKAKKNNTLTRDKDSDTSSEKSNASIEERVRCAFSSVGFPSIQATFCSNICILVLIIVPLYMAKVIVTVMCLCLTLCAIHSLVLLPALFTLISTIQNYFCRK